MNDIEQRLKALGIVLPEAPKPMGNFLSYLLEDTNLYVSGQVSIDNEGKVVRGKLGGTIDLAAGQQAAKYCAIGLLARTKAALGDLNRIEKLVKLGAFVNASPDFRDHPKVVNGASDFMVDVLGEKKGAHVRFAVGSSSLPSGAAVEIEALFKVSV
ncbi:MAG: RidA family protein [Cellvibrionaceae bacterium]